MVQDNLLNLILEINKATANDLFRMYTANGGPNSTTILSGLIFPKYRNDNSKMTSELELRISEQEARMLYCFNLNNNNKYKYLYSIETPTSKTYNFTKLVRKDNNGKQGRSALSDLSIYDSSENKLLNVEFKAHNPEQRSYDKDIEKLIGEAVCGNWFHLLKNADKGTIQSLNDKFKSALNKINPENILKENKDLWILFFIVILDRNETKHKQLSFSQISDKNYIEKLFSE